MKKLSQLFQKLGSLGPKISSRKLRKKNEFDWNNVEWDVLDEEKTKFIFEEAKEEIRELNAAIERIKDRSLYLLMINVPVLVALVSFVYSHKDNMRNLHIIVFFTLGLFWAESILLSILNIKPNKPVRATRSPSEHLADINYCSQDLNSMHKNLLKNLDIEITKCNKMYVYHSNQLKFSILFFLLGPAIALSILNWFS